MPIRRAATVMLLRTASDGLEVFLLRRSSHSAFAPDAYVFPGGALDRQDGDAAHRLHVDEPRLASEDRALAATALRELFEEAGVVFATDRSGTAVDERQIDERREELSRARAAVARGEESFEAALDALGWRLDARPLVLFSHWLTPPDEPRRFDTLFFAARAPAHQSPLADADETHDGRWISPSGALNEHRAGRLHLVYPTIKHLERIAAFNDADSLLAFARSKPIVKVARLSSRGAGYEMSAELEGRW